MTAASMACQSWLAFDAHCFQCLHLLFVEWTVRISRSPTLYNVGMAHLQINWSILFVSFRVCYLFLFLFTRWSIQRIDITLVLSAHSILDCTSRRSWPYSFQALVFLVFQARFFPYTFKRKILVWKARSCSSDKIHVDRILSEVARTPSPDKILVILSSCLFLVLLSFLTDSC